MLVPSLTPLPLSLSLIVPLPTELRGWCIIPARRALTVLLPTTATAVLLLLAVIRPSAVPLSLRLVVLRRRSLVARVVVGLGGLVALLVVLGWGVVLLLLLVLGGVVSSLTLVLVVRVHVSPLVGSSVTETLLPGLKLAIYNNQKMRGDIPSCRP